MIDPTIIIAASLWCGVPNLPMSSAARDQQINKCRKDFIQCVIEKDTDKSIEFEPKSIPEECLNVKLRK